MAVLGMSWKASPSVFVDDGEAKKARIAKKQRTLPVGRLMLLTLLVGMTVEALLGARLWAQLTAQTIDTGVLRFVFDATGPLISPFEQFEPSSQIKQTGILEIATLIAMQAYLIATVAVLVFIAVLGTLIGISLKAPQEALVSEPTHATVIPAASEPAKPLNEANLASN